MPVHLALVATTGSRRADSLAAQRLYGQLRAANDPFPAGTMLALAV